MEGLIRSTVNSEDSLILIIELCLEKIYRRFASVKTQTSLLSYTEKQILKFSI